MCASVGGVYWWHERISGTGGSALFDTKSSEHPDVFVYSDQCLCCARICRVFLSASYPSTWLCLWLCLKPNSVTMAPPSRLSYCTVWHPCSPSSCPASRDPAWARRPDSRTCACFCCACWRETVPQIAACMCKCLSVDMSVHCVFVCVQVSMTQRDSRAKKWLKWPQLHFHGNRVF